MNFVSNRNITVRSTKGHAVAFVKGVPQYVPPEIRDEVLEKGILPVDDQGKAVNPAENTVVVDEPKVTLAPENGDEQDAQILEVIKAIVKRNNANDFAGGGHPHADAVSAGLKYKVDQKSVRKVWKRTGRLF